MEQVINADKALWVKVSDETRGKVQSKTGEPKPFDEAFKRLCDHPEVLQHLALLQGVSRADAPGNSHQPGKGKSDGKGKQKGKGPGKAPGPGIPVPDNCEIYFEGKQICKRWQVGKCTAKTKPGKRCMIGYHICWKKGCHNNNVGDECPH